MNSSDDKLDYEFDIKKSNGLNVTENKLFEAMKHLGLNPRPQFKISKMTVDFAFPIERLVVEINGPIHKTDERIEGDKRRWFMLKKLGWKRKSFDSSRVFENPMEVAYAIRKLLDEYGGYVPDKQLMEKNKTEKSDDILKRMWDRICK
jgi:very-short-patch-repair endonuclease